MGVSLFLWAWFLYVVWVRTSGNQWARSEAKVDCPAGRGAAVLGLVAAAVSFLCAVGNVVHYLSLGDFGYALAFVFAVVALILARVILRTRQTLARTN